MRQLDLLAHTDLGSRPGARRECDCLAGDALWWGLGGAGAGLGGVGPGLGGVGAGFGGAGAGPGAAKSASMSPMVIGPTMPSGFNPCARW
jgi:hypothetical protein